MTQHAKWPSSALQAEGEVASGLTDEAIRLSAHRLAAGGVTVARVIDLGCGPGVGTVQLAERFPGAQIIAVDGSAEMLAHARARAERCRMADRIVTRELDLESDLRSLGICDLAYAAMAIHHVRDEVATLTGIRSLLAPKGVLCVLERADPTVVRLTDELGRPGIWERLRAARLEGFASARPTLPGAMNAERYPELLAAGGFEVVVSRTLSDTVTAPDDPAIRTWLVAQLTGAVHDLEAATDLEAAADPADLEAVRAYLDRAGSPADPRWTGATITVSRRLYVARAI